MRESFFLPHAQTAVSEVASTKLHELNPGDVITFSPKFNAIRDDAFIPEGVYGIISSYAWNTDPLTHSLTLYKLYSVNVPLKDPKSPCGFRIYHVKGIPKEMLVLQSARDEYKERYHGDSNSLYAIMASANHTIYEKYRLKAMDTDGDIFLGNARFNPFPGYKFNRVFPESDLAKQDICELSIDFSDLGSTMSKFINEILAKEKEKNDMPKSIEPTKIFYQYPATVVWWNDGTKTTVRCMDGEPFSEYAGFAAALAKKMFGTNSAVHRIIKNKSCYSKSHVVPIDIIAVN